MRLFLAAISLLLAAPAGARPALEKPNVIVILLDDAGYGDFAHTGNPVIQTPNLSRMVRDGANFPQFYSGAGACTASRYAMPRSMRCAGRSAIWPRWCRRPLRKQRSSWRTM